MAETWTFSRPDKTPTEAEKRLIAACAMGVEANCADLPEAEKQVSAELIVALGTGQFTHKDWPDWALHDRGLLLSNAIIPERVWGQERRFDASLVFFHCQFKQAVTFADSSIEGRLFLNECHLIGESDFSDAEITSQFSANRATFENPDGKGGFGRAVFAQGVKAAGWFMDGVDVKGKFSIAEAVLSSQFSANGATFENPGGKGGFELAILAQGVKTAGWFMNGAEVKGTFNINRAEISGQLSAIGATFEKPGGTATNAAYARITGGVWLADAQGKEGSTITGVASFAHAEIGTRMQLAGSTFDAGSGAVAISLQMARINGRLVMPDRPVRGIISLARAWCDTLDDHHKGWPKPLERDCAPCGRETFKFPDGRDSGVDIQHLNLDGFRYEHFEHADGQTDEPIWRARIRWLSAQSAKSLKRAFDPQPWRQCAQVLRETGFDEAAQKISIERRVRERRADGVGWFARFISWFLHTVSDYCYNPWKTVACLVFLVVTSAFIYAGGRELCNGLEGWDARARLACSGQPAFVQTKFNDFEEVGRKGADGTEVKHRPSYPAFNAFWYSLDVALPLIDTGSEGYWRANTKAYWSKHPAVLLSFGDREFIFGEHLAIGWLLYGWSVFQMLMAAILIAVAVTGFTGLLTRDEK